MCLSEEAKKVIDPLPYHVDFNKEACSGGALTIPEHRGEGLLPYAYYKKYQFLKKRGILINRSAVAVSNVASQRVQYKLGTKIYARARYLKILWWQSWKETPLLVGTSNHDQSNDN